MLARWRSRQRSRLAFRAVFVPEPVIVAAGLRKVRIAHGIGVFVETRGDWF